MRYFLYILIVFNFSSSFAGNVEQQFNEGLKQLEVANYSNADTIFSQLLLEDATNPSIWYNYGIAKYYSKSYAEALWAFEKSLKFNPKSKDALLNAELCQRKLQLRAYTPLSSPYQSFIRSFTSNFWFTLSLLFFLGFSLLLFYHLKKRKVKITGGAFILILLVLSGFCLNNAQVVNQSLRSEDHGIIIKPTVTTYLDVAGNDAQIKLLQGTRFSIIDRGASYYKIQLIEGQVFYLQKEDVVLI